ncbi:MAG: hypothetical protein WC750_05970 [Patescibacteria group bacterium]
MDQESTSPPEGFVLDQAPAPPEGFVLDTHSSLLGGDSAQISATPQKNWIGRIEDTIKDVFRASPEERAATAMNIYAISKKTGIPMLQVEKHLQELARNPEITGIMPDNLTNEEFSALAMLPFIGAGVVAAPVTTALSIAGYSALDKVINLNKFVPTDASDTTKSLVEMLDFGLKGGLVGGAMKKAGAKLPSLVEKFFQTKMTEMNLPSEFELTSKQVYDIFQTGKLTTPEQQSVFAGLGMTGKQMLEAAKKGLDIQIPGEKILRMVDKPGWAAFKKALGVGPAAETFPQDPLLQAINQNKTTTEIIPPAGKPVEPPAPPTPPAELPPPPEGFSIDQPQPIVFGDESPDAVKLRQEAFDKKLAEAKAVPEGFVLDIPEFKNTMDAMAFGLKNKYVPGVIEALQKRIVDIETKIAEAQAKGDDNQAFLLAQAKQLPREAIETIQGKINAPASTWEKVKRMAGERQLATFKIKLAENWKVPISETQTKKIDSKTAIDKIMKTLDNAKIDYQGEYAIITGYPKTPGPSGYGMAGPANAQMWENKVDVVPGQVPHEITPPKTVTLKPVETPELVRFFKDVVSTENLKVKVTGNALGRFKALGGHPDTAQIILTPDLFKRGNEQQLAITLAHEIGHLTDYLEEGTLKRGNLLGRVLVLKGFLNETFGATEITNKDLRKELLAVTQYLHPYDKGNVPASYAKYRESARELYAEAISLLFNSPGKMEELAPKFMELFFDHLDKKPNVKEEFFRLQELLNGTSEGILERRGKDIRAMFVKGDELYSQKQKEKELAQVSVWERIRQLVDDINQPIISKRQKAQAKGEFLPTERSPEYELEERSLVDNDNFLMIADIDQKLVKPLKAVGLEEIDAGIYAMLKRIEGDPNIPTLKDVENSDFFKSLDETEQSQLKEIIKKQSDRMDLANPLGHSPGTATEQLNYMREQMGPAKWEVMEKAVHEFHEIAWTCIEELARVGGYSQELLKTVLEPNKYRYVSFGVLQHLQDFVPATIKMQKGTVKEIANPIVTTILKMISVNRLAARQRAVNKLRDWLQADHPGEIFPAKKDYYGNFAKPRDGYELIHLLEDGKLVAYEVDQYIAKSVENDKSGDIMLVSHIINKVFGNQIFKNLYITYNPGFAMAFNPIRDFKRTYANLNAIGQKVSVLSLLRSYVEAIPAAVRRQKGIPDDIVRKMMETYALDVPFIDFNFDIKGDAYHGTLKQLGLLKGEEQYYQKLAKTLLKPVLQIMEGVRFMGSTLESLTKIAGYNELVKSGKYGPQEIAYITRNYIGTPNYRKGGTVTPVTNSVWIFSNIMLRGMQSDLQLATHPTTRSGFWWAHFKMNILPKLYMVLAATGVLGAALKNHYDKQTEYDKTNYITIPLGEDENGKAVYFRIPHDETGRLMAGLFWKVAMGAYKGKPEELQQAFAFGAGQVPNLAPGIDITVKWWSYLTGKNPYDSFRGQYLISDTAWKAGGWPALKKMVQWTANNSGLLQFATYSDAKNSTFESIIRTIPGFNRLIKVSDYGITEEVKADMATVERRQAQRTLLKQDLVAKGIERVAAGERIFPVAKEIATKVYGKPNGEQIQEISKSLKQQGARGDDLYINLMLSARSNEEKVMILRDMAQRYDKVKMRQIERELMRINAVSSETIFKARRQNKP